MPAGVKHRFVLEKLIMSLHEKLQRQIFVVELGVASGNTSEYLLRVLPFIHLSLVDKWPLQQISESGKYPAMWTVRDRTEFCADRRKLHRGLSVDVASKFENESQDLVFIDANHQFESVDQDISAWLPKIRHGGIISGHDIDSRKDKLGIWGVRRAVEKHFGKKFNIDSNVWWSAVLRPLNFEIDFNSLMLTQDCYMI